MWSALKGDIMEFVATIKQDVAKAINEVQSGEFAGINDSGRDEATAINSEQFNDFRKTFHKEDFSLEIAKVLADKESVAKDFLEKVPTTFTEDEFWCRY